MGKIIFKFTKHWIVIEFAHPLKYEDQQIFI